MTTPAAKLLRAFDVPLAGTMLVEASAGTGKTHTITTLFVRLVVEQGLSVREILVVTFTEAATAELRDRVRRRLRAAVDAFSGSGAETTGSELAGFAARAGDRDLYRARALTALRELDLAAISTIHAFCMRMLQEHAFESGARFDLALMPDTSLLVDDVASDYWASRVYELDPALYLLRAGAFEQTTARTIVKAFAKRPLDTPVLPNEATYDPASLAASVREAYDKARATWRAKRDEVRELLETSDALNRRSYSLAIVGRICTALDAYFAAETASAAEPEEAFTKLSSKCLEEGTKNGKKPPSHPFFRVLATLVGALRHAEGSLVLGLRRGAVDYVRTELPRRKEALRAQGFEDLLFSLDAALRGPRGDELRERIASRFRAALVDEFQDTDPVQYRIFRRLFHGRSALLLVGDPKQSIYAFRGADVFSYVTAVGDAAGAAYTLGENRRSDPSLVRAVNTIFAFVPSPFMLEQIGFHPVVAHETKDRLALPAGATPFEVLFLPREGERAHGKVRLDENLPRIVAAEISRFLRSGAVIRDGDGERPVRPGDIAVLTRKNEQARRTQAELRKLQIPTALQSEESVFDSEEAADVELLLRAVLEPTRARAVKTALATAVAGRSANEVAALETSEHAWDRWSEQFRAWQQHWDDHGFVQAYRRMLSDLGAEKRLLALVDGERRITNLLHLGELLHGVEARERLGRTALVRWLALTRAQEHETSQLGGEATELRLESDAHAVKLLTIHKSKGLEFPIVYCPFLYDVRLPDESDVTVDFHDPDDGHTLKVDIAPTAESASLSVKEAEVLAENQRLLYVALTRAKHRCSIVWGAINKADKSALAYTLHGREAYATLDDAALRAGLRALAAESGGTIGVVDLDADARGTPWTASATSDVALSARAFDRKRVDRWFRIGSFTALTRAQPGDATPAHADPEAHGRDHDEVEERTSLLPAPLGASSDPVILHAFPRGAKAGTMLHAVLEDHDFTSTDDAALRALVATKLAEAGYSDAEWGETLAKGVRAMLAAPLDDRGLTLSAVPRAKRADELEFVFPVACGACGARGARGGDDGVMSSGRLAAAFDAHASEAVRRAYAARLRSLRFVPLRGFLKGYIDLVFEHEGRFYVVDYKSNHLGGKPEDYRGSRLEHAMAHHDYYLQYHLYALAVHRWLARRVRGYDYDRHFGGVLYLFARGMSPEHPGAGVFRDRPSLALLEALSEAADG